MALGAPTPPTPTTWWLPHPDRVSYGQPGPSNGHSWGESYPGGGAWAYGDDLRADAVKTLLMLTTFAVFTLVYGYFTLGVLW